MGSSYFLPPPGGGGGGEGGGKMVRPYNYRVCAAPKGLVFLLFWSEIGYQFRPFWSEIGYGLCTLVLNWVCFLEELATSSSFGDKTTFLFLFTPTVYMP